MQVLLDTQVLYIAMGGEGKLPAKVTKLLADPETDRILSATSLIEIAIKSAKRWLSISEAQVQQAAHDLRLTIVPFDPRHGYRLFSLPWHHHDPFDRMLIATALAENLPLVGSDREFRRYRGLKVIW